MDSADVQRSNTIAFEGFALHVQSMVGLLTTLDPDDDVELRCGSHIARLLSKLSPEQRGNHVLLKVIQVLLCHGNCTLETYAILDDGSEHTMLIPAAAQDLGLQGTTEDVALIRQDVQTLHGSFVSFYISPAAKPKTSFLITGAFTATRLGLADQSYCNGTLHTVHKYSHVLCMHISFTSLQTISSHGHIPNG